jgi:hypothetical protein
VQRGPPEAAYAPAKHVLCGDPTDASLNRARRNTESLPQPLPSGVPVRPRR